MIGFGLAYGTEGEGHFVGSNYFAGQFDSEERLSIRWINGVMYCLTTTTIINGATVERIRLGTSLFFCVLMSVLVFPMVAAWTFGHGWLFSGGFHDLAGGAAIHLTSGMAALVASVSLGPRLGRFQPLEKDAQTMLITLEERRNKYYEPEDEERLEIEEQIANQHFKKDFAFKMRTYMHKFEQETLSPHNISLVVFGTLILWVGWLMFTAGAAEGVYEHEKRAVAERAMMNTFLAPAISGLISFFCKHKFMPA